MFLGKERRRNPYEVTRGGMHTERRMPLIAGDDDIGSIGQVGNEEGDMEAALLSRGLYRLIDIEWSRVTQDRETIPLSVCGEHADG